MSEFSNTQIGLQADTQSPHGHTWFPSRLPATSSAHRLFCFAYAGGSASIYNRWAATLGPGIDVCPIELPGHLLRYDEPPYTSMDALQADLLPALLPHLRQPFSLFGYSFGAWIAYRLACTLQRCHSIEPQHFFAAASRPPHIDNRLSRLGRASDAALLDALATRYAPVPEPVRKDPELLRVVLGITRADFSVMESYKHDAGPKLRCSVSLFSGDNDQGLDRDLLLRWQELCEQPCSVRTFPGNHFFINEQGPALATAVKSVLAGPR